MRCNVMLVKAGAAKLEYEEEARDQLQPCQPKTVSYVDDGEYGHEGKSLW